MDDRTLRVLEYAKILEMLAEHCSFSLSKEFARSLRPRTNRQFVRGLLSETTEAVAFLHSAGEPPFGAVTDVRDAAARAGIGSQLTGADLWAICETLRSGSRYKRAILEASGDYPILKGLAASLTDLIGLRTLLERSIGEEGEVLDGASSTLASIRRDITVTGNRIRDRMESIVRDPQMIGRLQESIITVRNDRYVVPVKQEFRNTVKGIVHDQSSSGATLFIEPLQVVEMNNRLVELRSQELEEVDRILKSLSAEVSAVADEIRSNVDTLARMDLIFAKGRLSLVMRGVEPEITDEQILHLRNARHPLLKGKVVPVSPRVGDGYATLVITGPNTGGKTVTLKVVGLLCLMAQTGLHIPADQGSVVPVFDGIYADIGDEQSIEQSLSTFSSHMSQIVKIVESATHRSLVLLDELGAGTDPTEGAVLAVAILNHLHARGCMTIATTHYGQLKVFTHETPGFENASMEFDLETLRPTYRLIIGLPGSSNALSIAERLGLKKEIVADASGRLGQQDAGFENLLNAVHEKGIELDRRLDEVRRTEQEVRRLRAELESAQKSFRREKDAMLRKARDEASQVVTRAKRDAEAVLRDLRELLEQGTRSGITNDVLADIAGETRRTLGELADQCIDVGTAEPERVLEEPLDTEVAVGQAVYLPEYRQDGVVVESRADSGTVLVQVGSMKVAVDRSRVRVVRGGSPPSDGLRLSRSAAAAPLAGAGVSQAASNEGNVSRRAAMTVRSEIDVRGMTVDDALVEVDRYLDEAALAGLPFVRIIHGKGTGALRSAVQNMLSSHHHVSAFRDGEAGEGGTGVTVASITA
jgi:DNA mismatch repair protein MutS2